MPSSGAISAGFCPSTSRCHRTSCQRSGSEAKARAAVAELRQRLVGLDSEVPPARLWIETLPDSDAKAAALLDDLSRA